jgi:hypothetical protein
VRRDQIGRNTVEGRLMNAETIGPAQSFARELDDNASISGLAHAAIAPVRIRSQRTIRRLLCANAEPQSVSDSMISETDLVFHV